MTFASMTFQVGRPHGEVLTRQHELPLQLLTGNPLAVGPAVDPAKAWVAARVRTARVRLWPRAYPRRTEYRLAKAEYARRRKRYNELY